MPPLPADSIHARACKLKCEKILTRPGNLLIIHCASGYNNVVITGIEGFTSIGRPGYFSD